VIELLAGIHPRTAYDTRVEGMPDEVRGGGCKPVEAIMNSYDALSSSLKKNQNASYILDADLSKTRRMNTNNVE
jgi:hypothetical protein